MKVRLKHRELALRLARGRLSQNAWARRIGVSRGHLSNLVNGYRPYPSPETRNRLLRALRVEFDELFEIEVQNPEPSVRLQGELEFGLPQTRGRGEMLRVWNELVADVRYGLRTLRRDPGFSLIAILTLALAIGANCVIFSALDAFVLRLPDYPAAESLGVVHLNLPAGDAPIEIWSYPLFDDFRRRLPPGLQIAAYTESPRSYNLAGGERPLPVKVEFVSPGYFDLLGVAPIRGQTLSWLPPEGTGFAILSQGVAESLFGQDRDAVGRTIELNTLPLTVAGVMPAGFRGLSNGASVWVPMGEAARLMFARRLKVPFAFWHEVLLKFPPSMSPQQLSSILTSAAAGTSEQFDIPSVFSGASLGARAVGLREHRLDRDLHGSLLMLFGAVGLVLLIACANLANLLLVRTSRRTREISLRASIGASRLRIFRQLLTESSVLALLGGLAALMVARAGIEIVEALKPPALAGSSAAQPMQLNLSLLGFTLSLSLLATILFGIVPAIRSSRCDLIQGLRLHSAGSGSSSGHNYFRSGLVVAEIALATILLVGAGLLLQSLSNLLAQPVGFQGDFLTTRVDLPSQAYSEVASRQFFSDLRDRSLALPGVEGASLANCLPIESACDTTSLRIAGDPSETGPPYSTWVQMIDENFLPDLGIPLLSGRSFLEQDRDGAPLVAIVNQKAADQFWPGRSPLGARIRPSIGFPEGEFAEVVGVVGNTRDQGLGAEASPGVYLTYRQMTYRANYLFLKTNRPSALVAPLRSLMTRMDSHLALWDTRPLQDYVGLSAARSRFSATLLASFAGLALVLSLIGTYGVTSFAAASRNREMAIRKAFGAGRKQLLRLVLRQGGGLVLAGAMLGALGSLGLTRFLRNMLFEVAPNDGRTLLVATLLLGVTSLVACYLPARTACRVDPMDSLRCD